ncbi:uncharacterized protein LOC128987948 isoform X1 [Macrosteles quadrilineatus]|uniref:uncharacterized protein LOC128987948 isoform X1 n=1 Tax=Macrosteles quadrilineatus TaxID=74068 RepID=UPI0023E0C13D|nr:uncharacterized protein LOC128987948 isoform X1 [Macrosteles quadrilineatus]XP_054265048.1 uncharacterized protein LOC128987948 isoform X1 [Macrosteles quadrilineatus]
MAKANLTKMIAVCPECEELVQILNNNFEYSMKLHKKSHPTIKVEMPLKFEKIGNDSYEKIDVASNDAIYTLQPLVQKQQCEVDNISHSPFSTVGYLCGNQPGTIVRKPSLINLLEAILPSMPDCVKVHINFFSETEYSRAICSVCKITIDPISYIPHHIKTKLHEDNIINTLKTLLPLKSKDQMKFVSFYNSNLYCNLCECKIILCSSDLHQSVNNIFTHNAEQSHSNHESGGHNPSQSCCDPATQDHVHLLGPNISEAVRTKKTAFENFSKTNMTMKSRAELLENSKSELKNLFSLYPYKEDTTNNTRNTKPMEKLQEDNMQNHTLKTNEKDEKLPTVFDNITPSVKEVKNLPSSENQVQTKEAPAEENNVNSVYRELLKTNELIRSNDKFIEQEKNVFVCKPCKDILVAEVKNLERRLMDHILGLEHNLNTKLMAKVDNYYICKTCCKENSNEMMTFTKLKSLKDHISSQVHIKNMILFLSLDSAIKSYTSSVYRNFSKTNAVIELNYKYFEQEENAFVCKLCDNTHIVIGNVQQELEGRLMDHILGLKHHVNTKLLVKVDNYYICSICSVNNTIQICKKLTTLNQRIMNHTSSQKHMQNIVLLNSLLKSKINNINAVYKELLRTNAVIRLNDKYIEQEENVFVCKLCNNTRILVVNVQELELRLMDHMMGLQHNLKTKFLAKEGNFYICKICFVNNEIPNCKLTKLERMIMDHTSSQEHMQNIVLMNSLDPAAINDVYRELSRTNAVIRLNDKYIEQEENVFVCKLCNNTRIVIENVIELQRILMDHVMGFEHNLNSKFLVKVDNYYFCTICSENNTIKSSKLKNLQNRIMNHTSSQKHMQNFVLLNSLDPAEISDTNAVYKELLRTNEVIRLNDKYIEREENVFVCKLCNNLPIVIVNVKELERRLMKHILGLKHNLNTKFLAKEGNFYICKICFVNNEIPKCNLPKLERKMMDHTSSQEHMQNIVLMNSLDPAAINDVYRELSRTNAVIRLNDKYIEQEENVFVCKLCNNRRILVVNVQELELRLMNHMMGLQHNLETKFLAKEGNFYICKICVVNNKIPNYKLPKLERKIIKHTSSQEHMQNIVLMNYNQSRTTEDPATINEVYRELLRSNTVIRLNEKYIEQEGSVFVCKLCNNTHIVVENLKDLEESIIDHIMTLEHDETLTFQEEEVIVSFLEKTELSDTEIRENLNFLRTEDDIIRCTLCDFTIPSNGENDEIIENLAVHLRESGHNANKKVSNEYIGDTLGNTLTDNISHWFNKLPTKYLEDIEYITFSPFKRFLSCKLCNSTIHPRYLKEHLEELVHTQEKELKKKPNLLSKSTHIVTDQNVLRHLDTLSSLLKKIQLKSPWQK